VCEKKRMRSFFSNRNLFPGTEMQAPAVHPPVQMQAAALFAQAAGTWWIHPLHNPLVPQQAAAAQNPPPPSVQHFVFHSTPEHYSKMLLRLKIAQPGHASDRHVVALFPFSMDKVKTNEDVRTRSPKLWTTRARCTAQDRCMQRHFEELLHTGVMTTFRFDLRHPIFANIPRTRMFKKYWTFTQPIDVFEYEIVGGLMVISLCDGTNRLFPLSAHALILC
jgi:hypothetical protein